MVNDPASASSASFSRDPMPFMAKCTMDGWTDDIVDDNVVRGELRGLALKGGEEVRESNIILGREFFLFQSMGMTRSISNSNQA